MYRVQYPLVEGNTSANTFVLAAYVQVLNHSANSVDATFPISVNVSYGNASWSSTVNITIASSPTRSLNQVSSLLSPSKL